MIVIILETVPVGLRGELTRWLIEPHPGVFIGHVSGMVRDRLWQKCCKGAKDGGVLQIYSTNTEQKFQMRAHGITRREIVEHEGLQLIRIPPGVSDSADPDPEQATPAGDQPRALSPPKRKPRRTHPVPNDPTPA